MKTLRRLYYFLRYVYRPDMATGERINPRLAWELACIVEG